MTPPMSKRSQGANELCKRRTALAGSQLNSWLDHASLIVWMFCSDIMIIQTCMLTRAPRNICETITMVQEMTDEHTLRYLFLKKWQAYTKL